MSSALRKALDNFRSVKDPDSEKLASVFKSHDSKEVKNLVCHLNFNVPRAFWWITTTILVRL